MSSFKKAFGSRLKQIRKNNSFTQEKLAEAVNINLRQLARIEAGESFVTAETLEALCLVLNISPSILFNFSLSTNNEFIINDKIETFNSINNIEMSGNDNLSLLKSNFESILNDDKKINFLNLAFDALSDKTARQKLKNIIEGMELTE